LRPLSTPGAHKRTPARFGEASLGRTTNYEPRTTNYENRMDYKQAGVDIEAGNEVVRRIRSLARGTFTPGVLSEIGAFGGLFRLDARGGTDPVLVASADGVGTKLRVAFMTGVHHTIGIDLVNHCVNDILVQGAQPLFFLDYLATGKLDPDVAVQIVEGLANACRDNGCALLGGETAEMPGFYADGEYDVAGFIVGVVPRDKVIDGRPIRPGDILIGIPSSGLHTNGYSLARRIAFDAARLRPDAYVPELGGSIGEALLIPHRSYLPLIRPLLSAGLIKGMAHITGGGIPDNLPRILPSGTHAVVDRSAWKIPAIFQWLQRTGKVPEYDMLRTFNMGIGLIIVCESGSAETLLATLHGAGEAGAVKVGQIREGGGGVKFVGS
jgi:phosphoribosylformylglycinamidine cyclo-ligase